MSLDAKSRGSNNSLEKISQKPCFVRKTRLFLVARTLVRECHGLLSSDKNFKKLKSNSKRNVPIK
jgi:hypothetical protein